MVRRLFCALLAIWIGVFAPAQAANLRKNGERKAKLRMPLQSDAGIAESPKQNPLIAALEADSPFDALIRLHVIAENDGEIAQARKLKVRDAVLERAQEIVGDCENAEEAWAALNERVGELETAAREVAEKDGMYGAVRAETGVFPFPDREYGGVLVPAGDYRAVRIVLGAGEGRNWWCVLYPTLCVPGESAKRSLIVEWIRGILGIGD